MGRLLCKDTDRDQNQGTPRFGRTTRNKEEVRKDLSLAPSEEIWHWKHLDLGLLTPRTEREHISSALGLQVCDLFLATALGNECTLQESMLQRRN